jgi:hypothetical protein
MWGLGYPGHCPWNCLQSMTSNFEPFSILFDDRASSLSSVALLICTSHLLLLLTIFNLVSTYVLSVRHEERETGVVECTFEELYRIPCSCFCELIRFH